jgi:hypothetical protein
LEAFSGCKRRQQPFENPKIMRIYVPHQICGKIRDAFNEKYGFFSQLLTE